MLHELLRETRLNKTSRPAEVADVSCEPSPHWSLLAAYGGDLTIEQFRNTIKDRRVRLHCYPPWMSLIPIGYLVYEEDRTTPLRQLFTSTYQVTNDRGTVRGDSSVPSTKPTRYGAAGKSATAGNKRKAPGATGVPATAADLISMSRPTTYRRNMMTGRREQTAVETDNELSAKVDALRANACRTAVYSTTAGMAARSKRQTHIVEQLRRHQQQAETAPCLPTPSPAAPPRPTPSPAATIPLPPPPRKTYKRPAKSVRAFPTS
jgi:hypothetical protein